MLARSVIGQTDEAEAGFEGEKIIPQYMTNIFPSKQRTIQSDKQEWKR